MSLTAFIFIDRLYIFLGIFFFHFTLSGLRLLNHSDKKVLLNNIKITRDLLQDNSSVY